jgi:hypothetical protein
VSAGCHVALDGLGGVDVHDGVEKVGFAVLAAEVLRGEEGGRVRCGWGFFFLGGGEGQFGAEREKNSLD